MKGAGKPSTQSKKPRDGDPWSGRSGFTTLDKDQRVVWEPGLPAMVTSRRQHNPRKQNDRADQQAEEFSCDLKAILKLSPEPRVEWLMRVLKGIPRGLVKAQDVFDIVTHPRFTAGSGNRVGQKMLRCVTDNILAFSEKQRDAFAKSKLFQEFAVQSQLQQQADSDDEEEAPRSRSASSSSAGADRRHRSRSRDGKEKSSLPAELPGRPRSKDEDPLVQEALRELEEQREADRRQMEDERRAAMEKEQMRKAKLGSAFLVDAEEEEDAPSMPMVVKKSRNDDRNEERPRLIDYAGSSNSAASKDNPVEAARFVESMGGGSVLQQAHMMLLQKAGGEMRSPSVVRRDRKKAEEKRRSRSREKSRSRTRRRRPSPSPPNRRQIANRRSRSRSERRPPAGRGGGVRSSGRDSGSYRSPTPDGRARGQARAARKAKMIASMLGMPIPQR